MNIDFYRNYIKIVDCGSLSAAARGLHIAQSALSTQLKQLEEEYHAVLFNRTSRQMELTDAGRILYETAKNIVTLLDASQKEISACVEGAQGTVRIGMTQAYPDVGMTQLLLKFQKQNPLIRYSFYEVNSNEIMELLRTGVVEIGIVRNSGLLPPFIEEQVSIQQKLCAYCCYNNPWITPYGRTVSLSSLDKVPIAISRGFEELLVDIFARTGVSPVIMSVSTSRSNPMMWAKVGAAIAIICTNETETTDDAESFCRPLCADDPAVQRQLITARSFVTAKGRGLSAAAQRFLTFSQTMFHSELI